jgi:hypothetical protein
MQTGANNSEILTIKEPAIELDELTMPLDNPAPPAQIPDRTKTAGSAAPVIKINTYKLVPDSIIKFSMTSAGFIPTIKITFVDNTKQFGGDFPKDGDLLEVYIRSSNDAKFKKLRINFDITSITSKPFQGMISYSLSGIMRIPDMFSEQQISLPEDSSYNHLLEICELLKLGFASNETKTDDDMPRFNPNNTMKDFLTKTLETCYKDEDSFFTSYIDLFYYLCFVNVNTLFSLNEEFEDSTIDTVSSLIQDKDGDSAQEGQDTKLFFTNHPKYVETSSYITDYRLFNNAGDIWMSNGYKRYSQYMDMDSFEFQSFFVDPFTTTGSENDFVILKGKQGDNSYEKQNKYAYLGRMYSTENEGNLHPNYHYSKILNHQNNQELNKMGLTIVLNQVSSNIYRYKRIPLAIFERGGNMINNQNMQTRDEDRGTVAEQSPDDTYARTESWLKNNFLSGWYVVRDYSINYSKAGITQTVNLIRREWPTPTSAGTILTKK